ncbi:MAG: hypothetical protein A2270_09750 [Elusimicrobia bacterium RIFOXYA12_FULL_51_18]|nr:MAG: hypothetical protein A2270_09750 [Elusimicrobia bacterium RIFOXYA12_FULL_51_18]OGS32785.1 MAG: hypothetical protein A2218_12065 [Elusimicrobia bacterium RIFOXYA2_FULL_53_38]
MKVLSAVITAAFAATMWAGNALAQFDFNTGGSIYDMMSAGAVPLPAGPAVAAAKDGTGAAAVKKWTVMVFINGKNNLEIAGLYNVNQMEKVGSTKNMNVVVEMGRMAGQTAAGMDGGWTGSKRFFIQKDTDTEKINSPVVMTTENVDMGDYKRVVDFVAWAKTNYPAKRYMLIIWNHGSGWMDPKGSPKGISFDDETGNYIRTPQIGLILKEAGKVDILAFDACLMQMGEVAYEVKDNAEVVVGSEETVPGMGYPYNLFLGAMARKPNLTTEETGAVMVESFKKFYDAVKRGAQLSAIRTSKLDGLAVRISEFAKLAEVVADTESLKAARDGVIRYDCVGAESDPNMTISFYGDLSQFSRLVASNLKKDGEKADALKAAAAALQDYIDKELVIDNKASLKNRVGRELSESKGFSVYLPPVETRIAQERLENIFEGKYTDFVFDKVSGWHDFVTFLYGVK